MRIKVHQYKKGEKKGVHYSITVVIAKKKSEGELNKVEVDGGREGSRYVPL